MTRALPGAGIFYWDCWRTLGFYPDDPAGPGPLPNFASEHYHYWTPFQWSVINPNDGVYNWTDVDALLVHAASFTPARQVALGIQMAAKTSVLNDYTPDWVYKKIVGSYYEPSWKITLPLTPATSGYTGTALTAYTAQYNTWMLYWSLGGTATTRVGHFPMWDNKWVDAGGGLIGGWLYWYLQMVKALATRYDTDERVHSIWITTGIDGEMHIGPIAGNAHISDWYPPNATDPPSITNETTYDRIWFRIADMYRASFLNKPLAFTSSDVYLNSPVPWLDSTVTPANLRVSASRNVALYCSKHNILLKRNDWGNDRQQSDKVQGYQQICQGMADGPIYATQCLGIWHGFEQGAVQNTATGWYSATIRALAQGARLIDINNSASLMLEQFYKAGALVDPELAILTATPDWWSFVLHIMNLPLNERFMWVGRQTQFPPFPGCYNSGWDGPWRLGNITVNATTYATTHATYSGMPDNLKSDLTTNLVTTRKPYTFDGVGQCVDIVNGLTVTVTSALPAIPLFADRDPNAPNADVLAAIQARTQNLQMPAGTYQAYVVWARNDGVGGWQSKLVTGITIDANGNTEVGGVPAAVELLSAADVIAAGNAVWAHLVALMPQTFESPNNFAPTVVTGGSGAPAVNGTRTEPIDLGVPTVFTWTFYDEDNAFGASPAQVQASYQLRVSTSENHKAAATYLWDSGVVVSALGTATYAGPALANSTTYYWDVMVWDSHSRSLFSEWCPTQSFRTVDAEHREPVTGAATRDHFRLGYGRTLEWLAYPIETASSPYRATIPADPTQDGVYLITSLSRRQEAQDMITRVYPTSAEGIALSMASDAPPTGYTLSTVGDYVEHDAGIVAYGIIEAWVRFDDISLSENDSYLIHPEMAANELVKRGAEYLRTRAGVNTYYDLEVVGNAPVKVGNTIHVVYHEYGDAGSYLDIDDHLYILGATARLEDAGLWTISLEVSTLDVESKTAAQVLAEAVRSTRRTARVV